MAEYQSWQDLFRQLLKTPHIKQQVLKKLGVVPITLNRWAKKEVIPNEEKLRNLIDALPEHQAELLELIYRDIPHFQLHPLPPPPLDTEIPEIPHSFYVHVFHTLAITAPELRTEAICLLVAQHIQTHLDPKESGAACLILQCLPPRKPEQQVRSLRHVASRYSSNWEFDFKTRPRLYGIESQEGYTTLYAQTRITNNRDEKGYFYHQYLINNLESTATYPIVRHGLVAGCLSFSSVHKDFFTLERQDMLKSYAHLLALAFRPEDFYTLKDLHLQYFPPVTQQQPFVDDLARRSHEIMQQAPVITPMTRLQADIRAWQDIEELLLGMEL